jgi:hypothetical protein
LPEKTPERWGQGDRAGGYETLCGGVEPVLGAEVRFTEWMSED